MGCFSLKWAPFPLKLAFCRNIGPLITCSAWPIFHSIFKIPSILGQYRSIRHLFLLFIKISTSLSPSIPLFHRLTSPNHHANIVLLRVVSSKRWGFAPLILHISLKSIYFFQKVNKKLYFLRKSSKNTCILLFYGTF